MAVKFEDTIVLLAESNIEFIVVGGFAARLLGSPRLTDDIDIVYSRSTKNMTRLVEALKPLSPYLRGAPPGLPFHWDLKQLSNGLNFTLDTTLGAIDLLGEITGGGTYEQIVDRTSTLEVFGKKVKCVSIELLIHLKKSAGRVKDFEAIAELESLRIRKARTADQQ